MAYEWRDGFGVWLWTIGDADGTRMERSSVQLSGRRIGLAP